MSTVEFGSRSAANEARDQYADHLCPDDDRRLTEVRFKSDTPEEVLDQARQQALDARGEGEEGTGQAPLTDHEREQIDFSKGRANTMWARSIKGIAAEKGVDDWTAYVDPTLTVDEHREVMDRAAQEGGGRRRDDPETGVEKAGRAARTAQSEQCDHARDHCKHGDPDACEFLQDRCGFDDQEVESILGDDAEIPGRVEGARSQLWTRYQIGLANAKEAAAALNEINQQYDQPLTAFDELGERTITLEDIDWQTDQ